jgi:hypothetical protein
MYLLHCRREPLEVLLAEVEPFASNALACVPLVQRFLYKSRLRRFDTHSHITPEGERTGRIE